MEDYEARIVQLWTQYGWARVRAIQESDPRGMVDAHFIEQRARELESKFGQSLKEIKLEKRISVPIRKQ